MQILQITLSPFQYFFVELITSANFCPFILLFQLVFSLTFNFYIFSSTNRHHLY